MPEKLCVFIIATCFFIAGFILGKKFGEAWGKIEESEDDEG
jgi:hypothetical protein